ncbi:MAG: accessory factor UbiK family protein [Mariprofundales bacterium]
MKQESFILDEVASKILIGLNSLGGVKAGVEHQLHHLISQSLTGLDMVSDERMQVQEAMIVRLRADLKVLEYKIKILESSANRQ